MILAGQGNKKESNINHIHANKRSRTIKATTCVSEKQIGSFKLPELQVVNK